VTHPLYPHEWVIAHIPTDPITRSFMLVLTGVATYVAILLLSIDSNQHGMIESVQYQPVASMVSVSMLPIPLVLIGMGTFIIILYHLRDPQ